MAAKGWRLQKLARGIAWTAFGAVIAYLAVLSVLQTCKVVWVETSEYHWDNPLLHALFIALVLVAVLLLWKRLETLRSIWLLVALMVFTLVVGNVLIAVTRIEPYADQAAMIGLAHNYVMGGNTSATRDIQMYPHQIGIWLYFMLCTVVAKGSAAALVQVLNTIALCGCYYGVYRITALLFHRPRVINLVILLCFGFVPLLFYVTWVYGTILGLFFSLLGVWFQLRYMESNRAVDGLLSCLWIFLAINMRMANLIVLVAMVIYYLIGALQGKRLLSLGLALLCVAMGLGNGWATSRLYAAMTDSAPPLGLPAVTWVALGLWNTANAPGWWDSATAHKYVTGFDNTEETNRQLSGEAKEEIAWLLGRMAEEPAQGAAFFYKKTASMWNNPTFQCFWIGTTRESAIEDSPVASFIYQDGRLGNFLLRGYMNLFQTLALVCTAAFLLIRRKEIELRQLILGVAFTGFFLFHLAWEAKAQYALAYFFLLMPYAAAGLDTLAGKLHPVWEKQMGKR